jgi:hypothetical protein
MTCVNSLCALTTAERDALSPAVDDLIYNKERGFGERYTGLAYAPWQQEGVRAYAHEDPRSYGAVVGQGGSAPAEDSLMATKAAALACYAYFNRGLVQTASGIKYASGALADRWGSITLANVETAFTADGYADVNYSGSATAGTGTTLTNSGASFGDLRGAILTIRPGTSTQESRPIVTNTGTQITIPAHDPWGTNPSSGTAYRVTHISGSVGYEIAIIRGTGQGQWRQIIQNTSGSNPVVYVDEPWDVLPDDTSEFRILHSAITTMRRWQKALYLCAGDWRWNGPMDAIRGAMHPYVFGDGMGTTRIWGSFGLTETSLTSATSNTITKSGAGWLPNQWKDRWCVVWDQNRTGEMMLLTAGGAGIYRIVSNTSDTLTIQTTFLTTPGAGHHFAIAGDGVLVNSGVGDGVYRDFGLAGIPNSEFLYCLHHQWQPNFYSHDNPLRTAWSSSQNSFYNLTAGGDFIVAGFGYGNRETGQNYQVDNSRWFACRSVGGRGFETAGGWSQGRVGTHWGMGVMVGDATFANSVIHNFYNFAAYGHWIGMACNASDLGVFGCALQNHYADVAVNGISGYFHLDGCWSENSCYFLRSTLATEAISPGVIQNVRFNLTSAYDPANLGYWIEWKFPSSLTLINCATTGGGSSKPDGILVIGAGQAGLAPATVTAIGCVGGLPVKDAFPAGIGVVLGYRQRYSSGVTKEITPFAVLGATAGYNPWTGQSFLDSTNGSAIREFNHSTGTLGLAGAMRFFGKGARTEKVPAPGAPQLVNVEGPETHTATGGSTTTVVKTGAGWSVNAFANAYVKMITGANAGLRRLISSNTATQIISAAFPSANASGDTFQIVQDYTYYYVARDAFGRRTEPSAAGAIEGPFPLSASRRIWLLYPASWPSGAIKMDILKGNTTTSLFTNISLTELPLVDEGQTTAGYMPETMNQTGGVFSTEPHALSYGTTVNVDASQSNYQTLSVTNGSPFTIANPADGLSGQHLTISIKNNSGGAMGAITLGSEFKLDGVLTGPANGKWKHIVVTREGSAWVGRITADIG